MPKGDASRRAGMIPPRVSPRRRKWNVPILRAAPACNYFPPSKPLKAVLGTVFLAPTMANQRIIVVIAKHIDSPATGSTCQR
jgi:hypothetical protein